MADTSLPATPVADPSEHAVRRWYPLGRRGTLNTLREMQRYRLTPADLPPTPRGPDGPCHQPIVLWDALELRPVLVPCRQAGELRCPTCAAARRREVRRIAHEGFLNQRQAGRVLSLVTVTAPGETSGHRRWSVTGPRGHRPVCGCETAMPHGVGFWNGEAGGRWNRLRTDLAREYPGFQFFRGAEPQDGKRRVTGPGRQAIHYHLLTSTDEPIDPAVLQRFALAAGFGCNVQVDRIKPGPGSSKAIGYVSKYVTKCADSRSEIPWEKVDPETGEVVSSRATFRAWSQSKKFGVRMKEHRAAVAAQRRRHAERLRALPVPQAADDPVVLVLDVDPAPPD